MAVSGFSTRETATTAAASGRHKKDISDLLRASRRASVSFLFSSERVISSISRLSASLSYMRRPVVTALPSIKIFVIFSPTFCKICQHRILYPQYRVLSIVKLINMQEITRNFYKLRTKTAYYAMILHNMQKYADRFSLHRKRRCKTHLL